MHENAYGLYSTLIATKDRIDILLIDVIVSCMMEVDPERWDGSCSFWLKETWRLILSPYLFCVWERKRWCNREFFLLILFVLWWYCFSLTRAMFARLSCSYIFNVCVYVYLCLCGVWLYLDNKIGAEGARHLSAALSHCAALTSLNLKCNTDSWFNLLRTLCVYDMSLCMVVSLVHVDDML